MHRVAWLENEGTPFPDASAALEDPDGLLAVGGTLSVSRLLKAYRVGIFPWYNHDQPVLWWSPSQRAVITPGQLKISRSLRKILTKEQFHVSMDQAFPQVIAGCAAPRPYCTETWLTAEMVAAYIDLHHAGHAHSIEVWQNDHLVGGLYGIAIGLVFCGESMFSTVSNASKIALVYLSGQLAQWGYQLIDCQIYNAHLASLGSRNISRSHFKRLLAQFRGQTGQSAPWHLEWSWSNANSHHLGKGNVQ